MAYGFIAKNGSGSTVINDTDPVYVAVRSGTLTSYTTPYSPSLRQFSAVGTGAEPSGTEVVAITLGVGDWVVFSNHDLNGYDPVFTPWLYNFLTNRSTLPYTIFDKRTTLPNPTGFGMAVYNSSGQCVWDAESSMSYISNWAHIPASIVGSAGSWVSGNYTGGNSVTMTGGAKLSDFGVNTIYRTGAYRNSSTTWQFKNFSERGNSTSDANLVNNFSSTFTALISNVA